jgi:hypothetical protein
MKRSCVWILSILFFLTVCTIHAKAHEKANKEECIAKCKEAIALFQQVGPEAALQQISQPDGGFQWKDAYVFVFETKEAKLMSHPSKRLIGWPMLEYRSVDNKQVFKEILTRLTAHQQGWITYQILIDQKPPPVQKNAFYVKVPNEDLVVAAGYHEPAQPQQDRHVESNDPTQAIVIEEFAKSEGILHGIAFDGKGHMFVGKNGKEILKVTPDGSISIFAVIKEAEGRFIEGPGHTFLYDMEFDKNGVLYAVAEDRVLKISGDGIVAALVEKKFTGNWGACGMALDQEGNIFYAYDDKIMKLTPDGKNELFLDGAQVSPSLEAIVGIDFSDDFSSIYACDGKLGSGKLVKIPIRSDSSAGKVKVLFHDEKINVEYMAIVDNDDLIIKGPWSAAFVRVPQNGQIEYFKHEKIGFGIQTIARGRSGFDPNALFGTHMPSGVIYKVILP